MSYSIGDPRDPKDSDPRFETEDQAYQAAMRASSLDDCVWAVWDDDNGDLLMLVFDQQAYVRD